MLCCETATTYFLGIENNKSVNFSLFWIVKLHSHWVELDIKSLKQQEKKIHNPTLSDSL